MRFRTLVLFGTLLLPCSKASAQNTLVAMISEQYRVAPLVPFAAFDPDSPAAPLPGSTIVDILRRTLDGISTADLSSATVCTAPGLNTGQFRGTQGFRRSFQTGDPANRTELRLLFGFDDDALAAIQAYEITISSASFITVPTDRLQDIKARTRAMARCSQGSQRDPSATRTTIKPVVADVDAVFRLNRPFADETVRALQQRFTGRARETPNLEYRLSMHRRLIALGLDD
jgi:hypothetical protein